MSTVLPAANVRVLAMNETNVTRDVLEWADGIMIGYVVLQAKCISVSVIQTSLFDTYGRAVASPTVEAVVTN